MNKKVLVIIGVVVVICLCIILVLINKNNKNKLLDENSNNNAENKNNDEGNDMIDNESVVIYFSATGNTKKVAELIKEATNSDIIEIVPQDEYTDEDLNYNNSDCRANKEQNDNNARPKISNDIEIDKYDVIYLGYPIWWGDVPKIVLTLLDSYDFSGKTIIPFCTSGGSSISKSEDTLRAYNQITFKKGQKFSSSVSLDEVNTWIKQLDV